MPKICLIIILSFKTMLLVISLSKFLSLCLLIMTLFGSPGSLLNSIAGDFQIGGDIIPLDPSSVSSVVHYGILGSSVTYEEFGYSLAYDQLYPFEGLQNYTSGIIHHVHLTGLEPGALYEYQCGDPSIAAMSDIFYFRTMPVSSPVNYPSRIAVVGDLGLTYNTSSTLNYLLSNHPDLLIVVGGVSYADMYLTNGTGSDCYSCSFAQTPIHETYQPRWDYWGRFMQPLLANVPTMVVGGKHENEEQAGNEIFVALSSRFTFPSEESGSYSTLYYSFNAGGIHFVVLSAYIAYDRSSDQYTWLEGDLYNVNRSTTPWLVAAWYPPWYSTFKAHYREAECMRVEMEDLLYVYGVDIVFNGRVHAYERSNRVYHYSLDPCGPVYITSGAGGCREAMAVAHADDIGNCPEPYDTPDEDIGGFCASNFTSGPAAGNFCWDQQPEYSAFRESSFGHGTLEVKNETHALWSWHRNQDAYQIASDIIYIVREPEKCLVR
ncbi:purple acid phosphatase 15-like isoform X2 [Mercurialis annua]|uniref:purple acid phosphatase 15-like isoform X2 n=1 Tax=Mercurialis annua TaxID=3986 RepID=UPI00215E296F|nr:purple acid phosphatase 15-like isoform X2 [Mercurialis annua]